MCIKRNTNYTLKMKKSRKMFNKKITTCLFSVKVFFVGVKRDGFTQRQREQIVGCAVQNFKLQY